MNELAFQPVGRDDIAQVFANETASYLMPWSLQSLIDSLDPQYAFWKIEFNSKIVGHLIYQTVVDESHLLNICIHPRFQNKGFGKQALGFWFEQCHASQVKNFYLEVRESNILAQSLYKAIGFEEIANRKDYYPLPEQKRENGIIMLKRL